MRPVPNSRSRNRGRASLGVLACAAALMASSTSARALSVDAAPKFHIDPSVRSRGMGGASGAVFWGRGTNDWANPALLGLAGGISYTGGTTDLYKADQLTHRWTLGYGGIGFAAAGDPFSGPPGLEIVADPGILTSSTDEVRSWGIGASLSGIAAAVAGLGHGEPPAFTRYADLGFGYNHKGSNTSLHSPFGTFETSAVGVDWGLLARGAFPFALGGGAIPARVEGGYAYSVMNANDVGSAPVVRSHRHGIAARFGLDLPASWRDRLPSWLAAGFEPLVSVGAAWDRDFISDGSGPTNHDASYLGGELGLAGVAFLRFGSQTGYNSWGYGLGLPVGRFGGIRYDEAKLAEISGRDPLTSHSWSVWADPVEMTRALR